MEEYTIDQSQYGKCYGNEVIKISSMQDVLDMANENDISVEEVFDMIGIDAEEETHYVDVAIDEGYGMYEVHTCKRVEETFIVYSAFGETIYRESGDSDWYSNGVRLRA